MALVESDKQLESVTRPDYYPWVRPAFYLLYYYSFVVVGLRGRSFKFKGNIRDFFPRLQRFLLPLDGGLIL